MSRLSAALAFGLLLAAHSAHSSPMPRPPLPPALHERDPDADALDFDLEDPALDEPEVDAPVDQRAAVDPDEPLAIDARDLETDSQFDPPQARGLLDALWSESSSAAAQLPWPVGGATFDIPIAEDPRVALWIRHFQGSGKARYRLWLSRITRFAPLFWPVLEHFGLPRDTIFLAMIESGFSTYATSWAAAAGPWQFMPATARRYGLEVGFWVDDRRDFERSTEAAAKYLKDLYDEFGDWQLAWAAYNTGETRIRRCVQRTGTSDFWKIARTRLLYHETKHYVPKLIAAAKIAKSPEAFGIEAPDYLPPFDWATITVTTAVALKTVASACGAGVTVEDLQALNPALYRGITPPRRDWRLRVPSVARDRCALGLRHLTPEDRVTYRAHSVKKGDSLAAIAQLYRTTIDAIVSFNGVDPVHFASYDAILVPLPLELDETTPVAAETSDWLRLPPYTPQSGSAPLVLHRVRPGDSLWRIARKYRVGLAQLMSWNGLKRATRLRIGQAIRIRTRP